MLAIVEVVLALGLYHREGYVEMEHKLVESVQVLKEAQEIVGKSVAGLIQTIRLTEQGMSVVAREVRRFNKSGLESLEGQLYIWAVEIDSMKNLAFKQLDFLSNKIDACLHMVSEHINIVGDEVERSTFSALISQCLLQLVDFKSQVESLRWDVDRKVLTSDFE
ncbi:MULTISPECIES: hypothetical protein [unclassified Pseudomonas]|uniref:hypothetical protein n=1 Tax=unclassified Pseudomonas TaxID=196821 RepID=UPI002E8098F9|nr:MULTISPECIES: hypothetical protein [unclassified Pseudomonas]